VSCCFRPMFPHGVIIEQVVEHEGASLNYGVQCGVESIENQSCFCLCCVVSWNGGRPRKSRTVGILLILTVFPSPMRNERCAPTSMAPNSWRFEGFLLVFNSDYCGVYIFPADNHLPGMRPACKQLYFLGHLQNHNWWYCAAWTPTLMFSCWLCIHYLLNNWNLWISSANCFPVSLEVLVLKVPKITFQNGILLVVVQGP
jgi:hypothetical protein